MNTPTLINLPPPPDPLTPSDLPGTPNSGTTSLSAISTTAIKDGHTGGGGGPGRRHHHTSSTASGASTTTLDAERADRISRLAGLERVATARQPSNLSSSSANASFGSPSANSPAQAPQFTQQPIGYFDAAGNPRLIAARSTVGSASATASIAGQTTTWTSGDSTTTEGEQDTDTASMGTGNIYGPDHDQDQDPDPDPDKMSDVDTTSVAELSDGGQESLVGFGEGAGSTISGPISTPRDPVQAARLRAAARLGNAGQAVPGQAMGIPPQQSTSPFGSEPTSMDGVETARDRFGDRDGSMRGSDDRSSGRSPYDER